MIKDSIKRYLTGENAPKQTLSKDLVELSDNSTYKSREFEPPWNSTKSQIRPSSAENDRLQNTAILGPELEVARFDYAVLKPRSRVENVCRES